MDVFFQQELVKIVHSLLHHLEGFLKEFDYLRVLI